MGKEKINPLPIVKSYTVKKAGTMDFAGLFKSIPKWLKQYKYDWRERSHAEKNTSTGKYLESSWKASRKVSFYVKYALQLDILMRDMTEVMVEMPDGKKLKRNKARLQLVFNSKLEKNYDDTFSEKKGSFTNFLKHVYERYIAKAALEKHEDKLFAETNDLIAELKKFLD